MITEYAITDTLIPILRPILEPSNSSYRLVVDPSDMDKCNDPFSTIKVIDLDPAGQMEYGGVVSDVSDEVIGQEVKQDFYVLISFQCIGAGAATRARRLQSQLDFPSVAQTLRYNGFSVSDKTSVTNLTKSNTTNNEQRYQFEVTFMISAGNFSDIDEDDVNAGLPGCPVVDTNVVDIQQVPINQNLIPDGADEALVQDYTIDLTDT